MRVVASYSFNNGEKAIRARFPDLLQEVYAAIKAVQASEHRTKRSREKTMRGRMLYSPKALNKAFKRAFLQSIGGWRVVRVPCEYPQDYYLTTDVAPSSAQGAFRELDFVKNNLGVEVQFGKYAFMVYNVCAKMTIFRNLGYIDCGVEIVPVKSFADHMSTGVSYFEQFVWDLQQRGVADIDVPVQILGIDAGQ